MLSTAGLLYVSDLQRLLRSDEYRSENEFQQLG